MRFSCVMFVLIVSMPLCFLSAASGADDTRSEPQSAAAADSAKTVLQNKAFSIFKDNCAVSGCHGGKHPEENLLLDPAGVIKSTKNVPSREIRSLMRIDTATPKKSYLLMKIRGDAGIKGKRMPRGGAPLTKEEVSIIELWVQNLSAAEPAKAVVPAVPAKKPEPAKKIGSSGTPAGGGGRP